MRPTARLLSSRVWRQGPVVAFLSPPAKEFVCANCRTRQAARRRHFSSTPSPPSRPPPASGLVALSSRRLIQVSGQDAAKFLQGIVTQNVVDNRAPNADSSRGRHTDPCYSAILNAAGRLLFDVFIYPDNTRIAPPAGCFWLDVDAGQAEDLERHLRRYKLRAKVSVRLAPPDELTVWHAWDESSSAAAFRPRLVTGDAQDDAAGTPPLVVHLVEDPRAPGLGYRIVTRGGALRQEWVGELLLPPPRVAEARPDEEEAAYRVRRYLHGVPEGPGELVPTKALPLEGNLDAMGGVDFRKGCYVGQELTIRTRHQGIVRKRILPVMLYGSGGEGEGDSSSRPPERLEYRPPGQSGAGVDAADIPRDTSIGRTDNKGRSTGKWLRGVGNLGLALCRLEAMTDVVLPGERAAASYDPADEFVMETGGDGEGSDGAKSRVKVKAFVPGWLRKKLDAPQHG